MRRLKCELKMSFEEIRDAIVGYSVEFPKYVSPLLNLANQFAQATRPKVVGQMSELIKMCPHKDFEGWREWYLSKYPNAIDEATKKIMGMVERFRKALDEIDERTVRRWVEDLVLVKTYIGLRVQEQILKILADILETDYRISTPEEESKGIDGLIGEYKISIKPITWEEKGKIVKEELKCDVVVFYHKTKKNDVIIKELEALNDKGEEFLSKIAKKIF